MVSLKDIMSDSITEREAIIYLLIENGKLSYRSIGSMLGLSHDNVRTTYEKAKKKIV